MLMRIWKTFLVVVGACVVAIAVLFWSLGLFERSDAEIAVQELRSFQSSARASCITSLRRQLHDPGSAEWVSSSDWPVSSRESGMYEVAATFRAQNLMGATVTQRADCVVRRDGRDAFVTRID